MKSPNFILLSLVNFLLLTGGWMLAIWARLFMPPGDPIGPEYIPWPLIATIVLMASSLVATFIAYACIYIEPLKSFLSPKRQFRVLVIATILATIGFLLAPEDLARLQIMYFSISSVSLGVLTIVLPGRLRASAYLQLNILDNLTELWHKRGLIMLWLAYRIEARYAQTFLGILWIVLLPLSTSLVLAFAFGQLLGGGQIAPGVSTVSFLLVGIVIFSIFRDMVLKARNSISGAMSIIGRVYFPREIIVILLVGEVLIDFLFVFIAMIFINMTQGLYPSIHYILLPIPILIVTCLSMALGLLSAWLSLAIRDLQQLLTVVIQLLFYMTVLYSPDRVVSTRYEPVVQLIPVTPIVVAFRDIILYDRSPDYYQLFYPLVLGIALLYFAYVYFKVNEDRFVDLA